MIDLNAIIQSAQGGAAVNNLAARFGLSPQQAQSAIDAVLPAITMALQNRIGGGGIGAVLQHLGNPVHQQSYADPAAAGSDAAAEQGGSVLGDLFGSHSTTTQVSQQAATASGVPASVIQAMLPVIVSMLLGGLAHGAATGGFGGLFGQVIGAVLGGHGGSTGGAAAPGSVPTGAAPSGAAPSGDTGGLLGSILGGMFGRPGAPAPVPGRTPEAPQPADDAPAGDPPMRDEPPAGLPPATNPSESAALDEFSRMFRSGTPASPEHETALANLLGR